MQQEDDFSSTDRRERTSRKRKPKSMFHQALQSLAMTLQELLTDSPNWTLLLSGLGVYREIRKLATSQQNTIPEQKLAEILNATRVLMMGSEEHPTGNAGYRKEMDTYHDLTIEIGRFSSGNVLFGMMLSLLGALIIVATGILSLVSFGILAPIHIMGFSLGVSLLTGGVSMGVGLTAGIGSMFGGHLMLFKAAQKSVLRQEMEATEAAALVSGMLC